MVEFIHFQKWSRCFLFQVKHAPLKSCHLICLNLLFITSTHFWLTKFGQWADVESLIKELEQFEGIQAVSKGRFFLSPGLAPAFQVKHIDAKCSRFYMRQIAMPLPQLTYYLHPCCTLCYYQNLDVLSERFIMHMTVAESLWCWFV